jgi:hypothetical protein
MCMAVSASSTKFNSHKLAIYCKGENALLTYRAEILGAGLRRAQAFSCLLKFQPIICMAFMWIMRINLLIEAKLFSYKCYGTCRSTSEKAASNDANEKNRVDQFLLMKSINDNY